MKAFEKKVVVITGASSGIGKALAFSFAREGAQVVIAARNAERLKSVEKELQLVSHDILTILADVSIETDCKNLIETTVNHFGKIDVLICNAGISMRALFLDVDLSVLKKLIDTNFWGAVYCIKYALPYILKVNGSIVGISSIAGKKGLPGRTGYSASKFALEGFLETLRTENLKNNLHVLVACPGFTASGIRVTAIAGDGSIQGESPRNESLMMQPEQVAERILIAVKKRKRDLVLSTTGFLIVWLDKFFPGWLDKVVYKHMAKEPGSPFK